MSADATIHRQKQDQPQSEIGSQELVKARLLSASAERVVLALPATEYQLHLRPTVSVDLLAPHVGKRIKGIIRVSALRMHPANGGGRFIEPVWGEPRSVAGRVKAIDSASGRVLVDVAAPMWVTPPAAQDFAVIDIGHLINFYVESGATFTPVLDPI